MTITLNAFQQQRRDTAANWTSQNPTLKAGEIGYETDTGYIKVGDGSTAWTSLAYIHGTKVSAYPLATVDIGDDQITAAKLADTAVTAGSYTAADITIDAQGRITAAANGEISTAEIADGAVTSAKLDTNIDVAGTLDVTGVATFDNNLTVQGDLTVNGTTTTIDSTTLTVEDKNIELGVVTTPTDVTADGGGITLKGATDHTIVWTNSTDSWDFSEHVNIASGKEFQIAGTKVLDATSLGSAVVTSSLTSVGTITSGTWTGTTIAVGSGGTGQTSYTNGQLLIGNTTGNTLSKATLTAGSNITITNGAGSIEIAGTAGTVTSVDVSGGTGLTATGGPVTSSGSISVSLDDTAVTAGSYTAADITVDAQGRITAAANGEIGTSELANDSVTADKLADTSVTAGSYTLSSITVDAQGRITAASSGSVGAIEKLSEGNTEAEVVDTGSDGHFKVTTEGTERLRIISSGNVGIGTSSPASKLDVNGEIRTNDDARFTSGARHKFVGGGSGNNLELGTYSSSNTSRDVHLVLDSAGNVGIGTTSPQEFLHVHGTNGRIQITSTGTGSASGDGGLFGYDGTDDLFINNREATNFKIFNNGSERLRLDSSGRLGIGTTSPEKPLHVRKDGESYPLLIHNRENATSTAGIALIASGSHFSDGQFASIEALSGGTGTTTHNLLFRTCTNGGTPAEHMRITSSGNVGIGTTSPSSKFDVEIASNTGINFTNQGAAPILDFKANAVESAGRIRVGEASGGGVLQFATKTTGGTITEAFRIDTSQRLLVGRTSSTGSGEDIQDSKGGIRAIPQTSKTAAYTLVVGDVGKHVNITTGGVTIPSGVFSVGDAVSIYNDSSSDQTITQGSSVTLRLAGDGGTGNKTLAGYGLCTVLCVTSNEFVIAGTGLS